MCDFSGRLVAWMDGELPDNEAADVERHVRGCSECRGRVRAYEQVSRELVAYCDAAMGKKTRRKLPRWVPVLASAAAVAAVLLLGLQVFQPASVKQIPVHSRVARVADASPAVFLETAPKPVKPKPVKKIHRGHGIAGQQPPNANWTSAEPAIQIAIPVEAMFPPGAVPEGITFIADLSIASDGSVQGLRLQQ
jgi:negative regulator of sigma E activity